MPSRKNIAWVDCNSGVAGNMLLGALVDLGFPASRLQALVRTLGLGKVEFKVKRETRSGIAGVLVKILPRSEPKARKLKDITRIISRARLPEPVKKQSLEAFKLLARAEAKVHAVSPEEVHFHELGAVDTILDIVGVLLGFHELGIEEAHFSRIRLGAGELCCEHGKLPVPAPATLELLQGVAVAGGEESEGELATPTGAVLARILGASFGPMPQMKVHKIGYGLGDKKLETRPNLLRIAKGESGPAAEELMQVETTIDDMNPEYYDPLMNAIFKAGALEAALLPAQLKKNRPGVILRALCPSENLELVLDAVFEHSTTTGIRFYRVNRVCLSREVRSLNTAFGRVRVKRIELPGGRERIHPEFEDLKRISEKRGIPLPVLEEEVIKAWSRRKTGIPK